MSRDAVGHISGPCRVDVGCRNVVITIRYDLAVGKVATSAPGQGGAIIPSSKGVCGGTEKEEIILALSASLV